MRVMSKYLSRLTVAAAVLSGSVFAAKPALADGEGEYAYISKVNVASDNYLYINVPGNFPYSHGCISPSYARSQYPLSDERTKAWMQLALASFAGKKRVYVWTDGCTTAGRPILTHLQMHQD